MIDQLYLALLCCAVLASAVCTITVTHEGRALLYLVFFGLCASELILEIISLAKKAL